MIDLIKSVNLYDKLLPLIVLEVLSVPAKQVTSG